MIVVLALLAALVFGGGVVLQQRAALAVPPEHAARLSLLVRLFQRPLWLAGLVADVVGFGLQAAALRRGSLIVVQPLITTSLLFTLVMISAWYHESLSVSEWAAVTMVLSGLAIFLIVASPSEESMGVADAGGWLSCALTMVVLTAAAVVAGLRSSGRVRAGLFGLAAGMADAFMAVLAKAFAGSLDHGVLAVFGTWMPYALVAGGIVALLLISTAYQAGPATVTLPIITVTDPLVGSLIGISLFGEHLELAGLRGPTVALALAIMAAGLIALGRNSRLVSAIADEPTPAVASR